VTLLLRALPAPAFLDRVLTPSPPAERPALATAAVGPFHIGRYEVTQHEFLRASPAARIARGQARPRAEVGGAEPP